MNNKEKLTAEIDFNYLMLFLYIKDIHVIRYSKDFDYRNYFKVIETYKMMHENKQISDDLFLILDNVFNDFEKRYDGTIDVLLELQKRLNKAVSKIKEEKKEILESIGESKKIVSTSSKN